MHMKRAICPGSFDPVTLGHIDIFQRASHIFDEVYIGVFNNIRKKPLLSVEERIDLLAQATAHLDNIKVISFDGLLADYMVKEDIQVIVRGLRSVTDYEYEQGQAQIIKAMHPELDTMFLLGSRSTIALVPLWCGRLSDLAEIVPNWYPTMYIDI